MAGHVAVNLDPAPYDFLIKLFSLIVDVVQKLGDLVYVSFRLAAVIVKGCRQRLLGHIDHDLLTVVANKAGSN